MYKDNRALFFLCIYIIIANWIYIGTLSYGAEPSSWSGGIAWGPRYLIPVMPFIMIVLGSIFLHLRRRRILKAIVISLCLVGFYVNLSGILIWFQYGLMYGWYVERLATSPNYMETMTWSPAYSTIVLQTKAMLADYVSSINPEQYIGTSLSWAGVWQCSMLIRSLFVLQLWAWTCLGDISNSSFPCCIHTRSNWILSAFLLEIL